MNLKKVIVLAGVLVGLATLPAARASIIWNGPVNISGPTDVQTNGTTVFAYGFGSAAQTVNGVTFQTFATPGNTTSVTNGDLTLSTTGSIDILDNPTVFSDGSVSGSYGTLMSGADWAHAVNSSTAEPLDVTLSGLTVGVSYEVQLWVNDARTLANGGFNPQSRTETVGGQTLQFQVPATDNGQYLIGNFTATGTSQMFTIQGFDSANPNSASQLNAIELLQTQSSIQTTPEPATFALTGGILALSMLVLRRRAAKKV